MFDSILNRKSGVDFLLDSPTNFEGCSIWCSILFDTEPEVDVQMLWWLFCCRCSGASSL